MSIPVPIKLNKLNEFDLGVDWSDGHKSVYSSLHLRAQCPCARCVDEMTNERKVTEADLPADVKPVRIRPVGSYALAIEWSDGHNTGIYTFERLRALDSGARQS